MRSTRRSLSLPSDFKEKVHVHLMHANTTGMKGKSPVTQLHECNDDHVQHIYLRDATEKSNETQHSVEAPDTMQADPIETEVNVYDALGLYSNKNWVTSPSVKLFFMDSHSLSQSPK